MLMQSTIADLINQHGDALTRAERQLAAAMLDNYPVSGLGTIADLAAKAGVSAPTVVRLVSKIGFKGFAEFQAALRQEVEARISNPIAKHDSWAGAAPQTHILNQFTDAVISNIRQSLARIDHTSFDDACRMMCDHDAHLFITGGRISGRIADYLFLHMQVIRPGVSRIEASSNAWPHDLLDLKQGDVLAVFDIRRYENTTLRMAEMAKERGARIILFTDQWRSPVARIADHTFGLHIEVPSAWDSTAAIMLLVETMISAVVTQTWDTTRDRMETLEEMFDRTGFFRKFK
jgi:DNA-binding MurR/RpiR family transcriptional regulator